MTDSEPPGDAGDGRREDSAPTTRRGVLSAVSGLGLPNALGVTADGAVPGSPGPGSEPAPEPTDGSAAVFAVQGPLAAVNDPLNG